MNPLIQLKKATSPFLIAVVLACFGFLPAAQAVVPPPDGGYPGFNTAEGTNALQNLTTGVGNTAVGWYSLFSDTDGSFNTALGAGTLLFNVGNQSTGEGLQNTAIGAAALLFNTTGDSNTAVGTASLLNNTAGGNTAVGASALLNNTTGGTLANITGFDVGPNVAVGQQALESNTVAGANTAVGYQALHSFTTGPVGLEQIGLSTAVGFQALANATGIGNDAFGYQALLNNTDGVANTAIGFTALLNNTTGSSNVATGNQALGENTSGDNNTAIGAGALVSNVDSSDNTAIGFAALASNTLGNGNTAVGSGAGSGVFGNNNTTLGANTGGNLLKANNVICIGANVAGENVDNTCYIGNIFGVTSSGGSAVFVNANGKLGTSTSSQRFKEQIKPMDKVSEALFALNPVSFRYKKEIDPVGIPQFGLVAEDVEKVNPDLVVRDKEGKPCTVRYEAVNAMLLNEFLKEHRKVEKLEATVAQQHKDFEAALADLKGQIQKVSAELELNKPAPQVAENNQ